MERLFDYLALALVLAIVLVVFAAGFTPAFFGGAGWGILVALAIGWAIQHLVLRDHGGGGIGESYVCLILFVALGVGVVVGLLCRWTL